MEPSDEKTFDFLSIMTGVVMVTYLGGATWALATKAISAQDYLTAIGSPALTLLGYWVRGANK